MKRFFGILSLAAILFCSCSSDDGGDSNQFEGEEFIGTWKLVAINVSSPIDANNDGTTSTNLLDEVDCLQETFILDRTLTWTSNSVNVLLITAITGNLYNVSCANPQTSNGNWGVDNGQLFLVGLTTRQFSLNGTTLTETIGENLPGIQSLTYEKQ